MQRELKPKLLEFLTQVCIPLASYKEFDAPKLLAHAAIQCIGIVEQGADNCGEMVELFQSTIGQAEKESWCMSFVQSLVAFVELRCGPSFLPVSEHCLTVFKAAAPDLHVIEPELGDLMLWRHKGTLNGHVGIVIGKDAELIRTVEGNTSNAAGVIRNGGGVYAKKRSRTPVGTMEVLGFLRPFQTVPAKL